MVDKKQILTAKPQSGPSALSAEETREILTPFAFEIDKTLFGLPLAVPWKRGVALLIDLVLIAILAETPGEVLAFVVAITFFRLGSKKRAQQQGRRRGFARRLLRYFGAFMLFVVLVSTIPEFIASYTGAKIEVNDKAVDIADAEQIIKEAVLVEQQVQLDKLTEQPLTDVDNNTDVNKQNSSVYKGVEWFKGIIDELGLSFGWAAFYFSVFTAIWHGQTPGKRLLKIRVLQLDGTPLSLWDSFGRYGGYGAGLATGLLGFLQIYWDPNRQAIHDKISTTVVIDLNKLANSKLS